MNNHSPGYQSQSTIQDLFFTVANDQWNRAPANKVTTPGSTAEESNIIEIRDPDIDVQDIMVQIRRRSASRKPLPPSAAVRGRAGMAQKRKKILASLKELKARVRDYGVVESHKQGWLSKIDLFIKRSIRKLMQRHILQQHRVNLKLHTVLDQLIEYLQDEDVSIRACMDQVERQWQTHQAADCNQMANAESIVQR